MKNEPVKYRNFIWLLLFNVFFVGCTDSEMAVNKKTLPFLSPKKDTTLLVNGHKKDTFYYQPIPPFSLINQDGATVTETLIQNKVYVTEFFFTSCPSICPKVSKQLQKVHQQYKEEVDFKILSHTIDPKHDTPAKLKAYGAKVGANPQQWHFLTGAKSDIYDLANYGYEVVVYEDKKRTENNLLHDGTLILVDQNRLIRGMYNGMDAGHVQRMMGDIEYLLQKKIQ